MGAFSARRAAFALAAGLFTASVGAEMTHPDEPGINPNRDYVHQHFAEHIDPYNGNLQLQYVDIFLGGNGGFDLKVQRSYNALLAKKDSPYGRGWQIHFGRVFHNANQTCTTASPQSMVVELPDGGSQTLYRSNGIGGTSAGSDYITSSFWKGECDLSAGGITMRSPDGTRYDMTEADGNYWHVKRIEDRNGNWMSFQYVFNNTISRKFVSSITTSDGRNITFAYSSDRLTSITANGRTWNYTVRVAADGTSYLDAAQPPAGSPWRYSYYGDRGLSVAGSFALQTVTYPQSGTVTYDYGFVNFLPNLVTPRSWTAVTSKRTTDGQWTFAYTPSNSAGTLDRTVVTLPSPLGTITYQHFGYKSGGNGTVWKIGLLMQKTIASQAGTHTETYSFSGQKISDETQARTDYGINDDDIYRALLDTRAIGRDGGTYTTRYENRDTFGNPKLITETGTDTRSRSIPLYFNDSNKWIIGLPLDETISQVGTISRDRYPDGKISLESPFGVPTTYTYSTQGDVLSVRNARGYTTTFSNDYHFGVPSTETRPEGVVINRGTDSFGNVDSESDGEHPWGYEYDNLNRVKKIVYPTGLLANITWTDRKRTLTRGSYTHITDYDEYGRIESVSRGGIQQSFTVDALGRKTRETLPGSAQDIEYSLDAIGRSRTITSPAGTKSFAYGASTIQVTNERGYTTTYTYDRYGDPDAGYLVGVDAGAGTAVTMVRDKVGTLKSVTQGGVTRTYHRDAHLFMDWYDEQETGTTTFGRDSVGNMEWKTISNGLGSETVRYTYDRLNRLKTIEYPGTAGTVTFTYDGRSKVKQVSRPGVVRNYDYDNNGNLKKDELIIDGRTFTVLYDYNTIDGLTTITYPSGGAVTYSPDALGRPQAASPYLSNVQHHPSGNLKSTSYQNGIVSTYGENAWQLPNGVSAPSVQIGLTYLYDGAGNVQTITDAYGSTYDRSLTYDSADRLKTVSGPWGSGALDYSGDGNLKYQQFGSYRIDYGYVNSKLSTISGSRSMSFTYDKWGNVTGNGATTFNYDAASQMTCAKCGTPDEVKYQYDGQGRRVSEEKAGYKTYFLQAPNGDLQYEYAVNGKVWTKNIYLHGKRVASETDSDATPTTASLSGPSSSVYGSPATFNVTVSPSATGRVEIRAGNTVYGWANLASSQASIPVSTLPTGAHWVIAAYLGDANNRPSTSTAKNVTVSKRSATVSLSSTPASMSLGQSATLAATVAGTSPTGEVEFAEGSTILGRATMASGTATLATAPLTAGVHGFTATYLGDANHLSATSTVASSTVNQGSSSIALSSSNPTSYTGQVVTFTATVPASGSFWPGGTMTFYANGVVLGTSSLGAQGSASFLTNTLGAGSHSITTAYSGDANYVSSGSSPMTQVVVAQAASSTQMVAPSKPTYANQTMRLPITVTGTSPSGTVHVTSGGVEVGTATIVSGSGIAQVRLPIGTHTLQAAYDGDAGNGPSASSALSVTVRPGQQPQDFNLDAKADLLWVRPTDRTAMTWQLNGATIDLNSPSFGTGPADTELIGSGDFDGNGKADLLWFRTTDRVVLAQLSPAGGQQTVMSLATDWTLGGISDYNGDGIADVFWFNVDGRTMVWLMNGTQVTTSTIIAVAGAGYLPILAADFNGDGKADLLSRRASDGMLRMVVTDGAAADVGVGPAQHQLRTTADVNGDGKADLVWFKSADNTALAWTMNGAQHVADVAYAAGVAGYEVIGAGDFNGDGSADLLWFRPSSDAMLAMQFTGGAWAAVDNADPGWRLRGLGDELVVGTPIPPLLISPTGTIGTANPNYKWSAASRASSYYLLVQNTSGVAVGELHSAAELNCGIGMGVGTCTWTPSSALSNGSSYNWFVYAMNSEGVGQWSMPTAISVSVAAPTVPVLITPSGTITTTSPQYQWNAFPGATAYYLLVQNTAGVAVSESHTANELGCASEGVCSWISTSSLTNGTTYAWFVNATTPTGTTQWSNGNTISVNAAGPSIPPAPAQLDPSGTISTLMPTYRWNMSPGATSYYLLVQNTAGVVVGESHTAAELGCAGGGTGVCTWTPSTSLASNTTYSWFVNATNNLGTSGWSAGKSITTQ